MCRCRRDNSTPKECLAGARHPTGQECKMKKLKLKIKKEEVEHIAGLARLKLSNAEIKKMQKEMQGILAYIEQLNEADVSKGGSNFKTADLKNVLREDKAEPAELGVVRTMLEQAPEREGDYYKVKKVLT